MYVRLASGPTTDSIVDGPGLRTVIWFQGCEHNCKNCHNPQTHSFSDGELVDVKEIVDFCINQELQSGVTISGGDPFYQPEQLLYLVKALKEYDINIWIYTGFKYEELLDKYKDILKYIDVLVDGLYVDEKRDLSLSFRGSSNQRLIDVQESIKNNDIVTIER